MPQQCELAEPGNGYQPICYRPVHERLLMHNTGMIPFGSYRTPTWVAVCQIHGFELRDSAKILPDLHVLQVEKLT